jgi:hypothetical protein
MTTKIKAGYINNKLINITINKTLTPISVIVRINNIVLTILETNRTHSFLLEKMNNDNYYTLSINGGIYYQSNRLFSYELEFIDLKSNIDLSKVITYDNKKETLIYDIPDNIFVNEISLNEVSLNEVSLNSKL